MSASVFSTTSASPSDLFTQVYDRYWKRMYNAAFHYTHDSELAKEIVQAVFESLWRRWDSVAAMEWLEAYLLKAVKLHVAAHYRQQASRQQHLAQLYRRREHDDCSTDNQLSLNELTQQVHNLIGQLPGQRRRVFELSRQQGLTNREIAAELALAEKTVENHLTHALHFLRSKLSDWF